MMNILFFGDVVGDRGVNAVSSYLPGLKQRYDAFCIVNGENAAGGFGMRYCDYRSLRDAGADVVTSGNHYNDHHYLEDFIEETNALVRPRNLIYFDKGYGTRMFEFKGRQIAVTNLLASAFMKEEVSTAAAALKAAIAEAGQVIHIVDFHGESSSEKAMHAYEFDGEISALIGTHTHVQTNDARILPNGTAFITDVGMCGDYQSIIGYEPQSVINRLRYGSKQGFRIAKEGHDIINACLLEFDEDSVFPRKIRPIYIIDGKERVYG